MKQTMGNKGSRIQGHYRLLIILTLMMTLLASGCSTKNTETSAASAGTMAGTTTQTETATSETAEPAAAAETETEPASVEKTEIIVMAAASLTEMFTEVEGIYEAEHPDIDLLFSFAGSQSLATQIQEGVEADVFASANKKYMTLLEDESFVESSDAALFAKNKLAVIAGKSVTALDSYDDLDDGGYKIVIADETVPVGKYTVTFLSNVEASIPGFTDAFNAQVVSKETNVKLVASKVELGEADCGIVYTTDLTAANKDVLNIIDIPNDVNVIAEYPIAKLKDSAHPELAQSFVDYMLSEDGKAVLVKYGFSIEGL
ncbi:MAG: molybdate transport system substrate-binding protein [Clostridiales bacterium]|nr:molybdate transport system substrate-binding protein [Clostridiales bacterium]